MSVEDDLTRLRKGDVDALGTLIEQYQTRLYRYCCAWCTIPQPQKICFSKRGFAWLKRLELRPEAQF